MHVHERKCRESASKIDEKQHKRPTFAYWQQKDGTMKTELQTTSSFEFWMTSAIAI